MFRLYPIISFCEQSIKIQSYGIFKEDKCVEIHKKIMRMYFAYSELSEQLRKKYDLKY
jgi:hypothetical protein